MARARVRLCAHRATLRHVHGARDVIGFYAGWMLDLNAIDVEEIATALADQSDYEHRWLIDPRTGELAFWTSDLGIDGENPVEFDELDLVLIDPQPWAQVRRCTARRTRRTPASRSTSSHISPSALPWRSPRTAQPTTVRRSVVPATPA